jgi:hypothetical protein
MTTSPSPWRPAALVKQPKTSLAPNFAPFQKEVARTNSAPLTPKSLGCLAGGQPPNGNQGLSTPPSLFFFPLWLPWQFLPATPLAGNQPPLSSSYGCHSNSHQGQQLPPAGNHPPRSSSPYGCHGNSCQQAIGFDISYRSILP